MIRSVAILSVGALLLIACIDHVPQPRVGPVYDSISASLITGLDREVEETSGLMVFNGNIWTHNDSGGEAILYQVDTTQGKVATRWNVVNANNNDWEDISQDSTYIYIADFGNNRGSRKNLQILKFPKPEHLDTGIGIIADVISFEYEDQEIYPNSYNHNFDCESFISLGDSIILFTKNWDDNHSKTYMIPNIPGHHIAQRTGRFNTEGVITSATFGKDRTEIVLLGYNFKNDHFSPFIWHLTAIKGSDIYGGQQKRYNILPDNKQMEGIAYKGDGKYWISSEARDDSPAALWQVSIPQCINPKSN